MTKIIEEKGKVRVVLITGAAGYWGARLAARLATEPGLHVIGLDEQPPAAGYPSFDFIQADVRNPLLADLLTSEGVHTVCHLKFVHRDRPSQAVTDVNVRGTRNLLDACAEAGVKTVILKSSTAVYGAHPDNSALLSEEHALRGGRRYGYVKDMLEIEAICRDVQRQIPELRLTVLRYANIVGPTVDSPMTRWLKNKWVPVLLGFDPLLQLIHEDDVIEALAHATGSDVPGVFNLAAEGVMPSSQIIALVGRLQLPIPHPLAYWTAEVMGRGRSQLGRYLPIEPDYLRYPWVADLTRMREVMGFVPRYTANEALSEFAARRRRISPQALAADEKRLQAIIERRRRAREQQMASPVNGDLHE
jgi:UDP-glucose 4-epimerase